MVILNDGSLRCLSRVSRQSQWAPGPGDHRSEPPWSIGNRTDAADDDDDGDDTGGVGDAVGDGDDVRDGTFDDNIQSENEQVLKYWDLRGV